MTPKSVLSLIIGFLCGYLVMQSMEFEPGFATFVTICCAFILYRVLVVCCPRKPAEPSGVEAFEEEDENKNEGVMYFFFADWCGFCQKVKPEWKKLTETKKVNGKTVKYMEVDADDKNNKKIQEQHDVTGFPTFVFKKKDGTSVKYSGERTSKGLIEFMKKHI